MISKVQMKFIRSLHLRKFREKEGLFIAEGVKIVEELLGSEFELKSLFATDSWQEPPGVSVERITDAELNQISLLESPNKVLAVAHLPEPMLPNDFLDTGPVLVLDGIQDPGNFGTILRTCDWFGFTRVICLPGTVEPFSPKVVQASMGSVFRVRCLHAVHNEAIELLQSNGYALLAAVPDGTPAGPVRFQEKTALILGSESAGITASLLESCDLRIAVPRAGSSGAESLNVATAASILCYLYQANRAVG